MDTKTSKFKIDKFYGFKNGYGVVRYKKMHTFIDRSGNPITGLWFDDISYFNEYRTAGGSVLAAHVVYGGKTNLITNEGRVVFKEWHEETAAYDYGVILTDGGRKALADYDGNMLSDWFDNIGHENWSYRIVTDKGKFNLIGSDGKTVLGKWFDEVNIIRLEGGHHKCVVKVRDGKVYKLLRLDGSGEQVFNMTFEYLTTGPKSLLGGSKGKAYILDPNTAKRSEAFDSITYMDGVYKVCRDGKYNVVTDKSGFGTVLPWCDAIEPNIGGFEISNNGMYGYVRITQGGMIRYPESECPYDFKCGFSVIKRDGLYNYVSEDNVILSDRWFTKAYQFSRESQNEERFAMVRLKTKTNIIDDKGNLLLGD